LPWPLLIVGSLVTVGVFTPNVVISADTVSAVTSENALLALTACPELDAKKVALGERLFHDSLLPGNQGKSCASCHDLQNGGDDNRQYSFDTLDQPRALNSPTVFNVTHNFRLTWTVKESDLKHFFASICSVNG